VPHIDNPSVQEDPWLDVTYPLSRRELLLMTRLKTRVELQHWFELSAQEASRLCFAQWLVSSHRLTEWVGVWP
jgi:hypothetical protein